MSDVRLGEVITAREAKRDALHVAVAPVYAGQRLDPCDRVYVSAGRAFKAELNPGAAAVGIVDPFLTEPVYLGQRFWLLMMPGSVTALRHEWEHPAFAEAPPDSSGDGDDDCAGCW